MYDACGNGAVKKLKSRGCDSASLSWQTEVTKCSRIAWLAVAATQDVG